MTCEEAKNYIWRNHCAGDGCPHSVDGVVISCKECPYDFAIRALENVSKKREEVKRGHWINLYCGMCGQAIDWSGEVKMGGDSKCK